MGELYLTTFNLRALLGGHGRTAQFLFYIL